MKKKLIINALLLLGTHYINTHHIRYFKFTSIFTLFAFIYFIYFIGIVLYFIFHKETEEERINRLYSEIIGKPFSL